MDQDEQDKSYHIPHYQNNPAHYDPAIPAITQNLEAHSQANGPSQYWAHQALYVSGQSMCKGWLLNPKLTL